MFVDRTGAKSPDDEKILEDARSIFRQLGIQKPEPDLVSWADRMPPDFVLTIYGEIVLPMQMIGKLRSEEWRPLVASSIIFNYVILRRQVRGLITRIILPLAGAVVLILALARLLDPAGSNGILEITLAGGIISGTAIAMILPLNRYSHGARFKADREAARIVGRDSMLNSLARIRDLSKEWNLLKKPRGYGYLPSLSQRIARMQKES